MRGQTIFISELTALLCVRFKESDRIFMCSPEYLVTLNSCALSHIVYDRIVSAPLISWSIGVISTFGTYMLVSTAPYLVSFINSSLDSSELSSILAKDD